MKSQSYRAARGSAQCFVLSFSQDAVRLELRIALLEVRTNRSPSDATRCILCDACNERRYLRRYNQVDGPREALPRLDTGTCPRHKISSYSGLRLLCKTRHGPISCANLLQYF